MTAQTRTALKELQQLDHEIVVVRASSQSFEPLLEEIDGPVLQLEQEVQALEKRLKEIRIEENRIELTIEERRVRVAKLEERMDAVRNIREEAAVHAELEMVRRALESEEQEALSLLDQINRLEERVKEQETAYNEALAEVGPRREELAEEQRSTEGKLEALRTERDAFADGIDPNERRVYDSIMAGSGGVAVSELTQDGACGNCYNMVPLQIQNRIRHGAGMVRCEGCGVILTPESPEGLARAREEGERIELALKASTEERDTERAAVFEAEERERAEEAASKEVVAPEVAPEEPAVEEADDEEGAAEEPAVEEVADEEVAAEEPVVEEADDEEGAAEEPAVEEVADEEGAAEEPAVESVADEEGADDEPTVEKADAGEVAEADVVAEGGDEGELGADEAEPQETPADA